MPGSGLTADTGHRIVPAPVRCRISPCATTGTATVPQVATDLFHSLRTAPYSMGAHEEAGGLGASYAVFGGGCAGSNGVPTNSCAPTPSLGSICTITFGNLPSPGI